MRHLTCIYMKTPISHRSIAVAVLAVVGITLGAPAFARHVSRPVTISGIVREKSANAITITTMYGRKSASIVFTDRTTFTDRRGLPITQNEIRTGNRVIVRGWDPGHKQGIQASSVKNLSQKNVRSGIIGQILIGPACPVQGIRDPGCPDQPYQGTVIVWNANKTRKITQFTSSPAGRFSIPLPVGTYVLDPQSPPQSIYPRGEEQTVVVGKGRMTRVTIFYDSGIRY